MNFDPGLRKVATALFHHLNTPVSLSQLLLLRYGEWDQLASRSVDPRNYLEGCIGAEKYRRDAQACNFLRKSPLLPTSFDRKKAAIETFHVCEKQCHQTNRFLELLRYPSANETALEGRLRSILIKAQKIAGRILGPVPDDLEGRFGPGTSFELEGEPYTTVADKLWITPHATPACMPLFEHMFWRTHWGRQRLVNGLPLPGTCRGNRFTTVPKDATKDRGICVEPLGNLWVQLGIGGYLKRRLAAVGIKIARQAILDPIQQLRSGPVLTGQTIHRQMARDGSDGGGWATIDLSNASDTVALELVRWVLPRAWFELLYACRSPFTRINRMTSDGKFGRKVWHRLEKFSSMGNGATFEMETLVFAVILAAGLGLEVGRNLFVYGDDILIPETTGRDALALLMSVGLTPNDKKSFTSGPFRESCGGDFFSGYPVRSVYADKDLTGPLQWVSLHNNLRHHWPGSSLAQRRCVEQVPTKLWLFGPRRLGDRVFHGTPLRFWVRDGIRWVATIGSENTSLPLDRWSEWLHLTLAVLGVPSQGITPRRSEVSYHIAEASIT